MIKLNYKDLYEFLNSYLKKKIGLCALQLLLTPQYRKKVIYFVSYERIFLVCRV